MCALGPSCLGDSGKGNDQNHDKFEHDHHEQVVSVHLGHLVLVIMVMVVMVFVFAIRFYLERREEPLKGVPHNDEGDGTWTQNLKLFKFRI